VKALVTGFEPFGGDAINPSSLAVSRIGDWIGNTVVRTAVLPCSFARSADVLRAAIDEVKPDFVLCVGLAGGRSELCLERVGINVQDARIPDNDARQPIDVPVVQGGPAAHFATLPIKACVAEMRKAGLPAAVSNSAGTFVCNHILYALMDMAATAKRPFRGGFLHVPNVPEMLSAGSTVPSVPVETIVKGIEIIVAVSAERTADIHSAEGRIS
jgi:pyroglutamyl-peptidase